MQTSFKTLLPLLLLLALPTAVRAQFTFTTNNGAITITGHTGLSGTVNNVTIPSTTNGWPVTTIGSLAFYGCTSLTNVTIPASVTNIGSEAFSGCTNLTGVYFRGGAPSADSSIFSGDNKATVYYLPGTADWYTPFGSRPAALWQPQVQAGGTSFGVRTNQFGFNINWASGMTIVVEACTNLANPIWSPLETSRLTGDSFYFSDPQWLSYSRRFYRLRWLSPQDQYTFTTNNGAITITGYTGLDEAVAIPGTINGLPVTSIGNDAFVTSTGLTSVMLPDSITNIGNYAFSECIGLTNITIGTNVTSIGNSAFWYCVSLTSVTIPKTVTNIGDFAFLVCVSLNQITVDALNPAYSGADGVLFNKSQTTLIQCPGAKAGPLPIPNSVTNIGQGAVFDCTNLTSVAIPDSVISIGDHAFSYSSGLTSLTMGKSVSSIGDYAFYYCTGLAGRSTIPDSVTSIGTFAFGACTNLTDITIGNSVSSIGDGAFWFCARLTSVTIPNSLANIGSGVFAVCSSLASVTIPNSVTSIGSEAFWYCTSLTRITIPGSVANIGDSAFYFCTSLTGVYFQGNAPSAVGSSVFNYANYPTGYYLPGTTGWEDFSNITSLPVAPWQPQVQTGDGSFGVRTNQFGFNINWASGKVVVVEACTNPANPVWSPVGTNTLTGGSSYFSDPQWKNYTRRFYRLRSP